MKKIQKKEAYYGSSSFYCEKVELSSRIVMDVLPFYEFLFQWYQGSYKVCEKLFF